MKLATIPFLALCVALTCGCSPEIMANLTSDRGEGIWHLVKGDHVLVQTHIGLFGADGPALDCVVETLANKGAYIELRTKDDKHVWYEETSIKAVVLP